MKQNRTVFYIYTDKGPIINNGRGEGRWVRKGEGFNQWFHLGVQRHHGHPMQCFNLQGHFFAKRNKIYQETARNFVFSRAVPTGFRLGGCIPKFGPPSIPGPPKKIFPESKRSTLFVRKQKFRNLSQKNFFPRNFQNFQRRNPSFLKKFAIPACQGPLPPSWAPFFTFWGGTPPPPRWHGPGFQQGNKDITLFLINPKIIAIPKQIRVRKCRKSKSYSWRMENLKNF